MFFAGADPYGSPETEPLAHRWMNVIRLFLRCVDRRYGNLLHFPFLCDPADQPTKTMMVFDLLRDLYTEKLIEDEKKTRQR